MELEGFTVPIHRSLHVFAKGRKWSLEIRRRDNKTDKGFKKFHEKRVKPENIREFFPHWKRLQWKKTPEEFKIIHEGHEYQAQDEKYRARVYIRKDVKKTTEKVIKEIKEVIAEKK